MSDVGRHSSDFERGADASNGRFELRVAGPPVCVSRPPFFTVVVADRAQEPKKAPGSDLEVAAVSPFFNVGAGSFESGARGDRFTAGLTSAP